MVTHKNDKDSDNNFGRN